MKNDMQFTGKNGEFQIRHMVEKTQLNFPVANEEGIKSSVTQTFGGDCKLDQNHFLLEPVSIENLHNNRSTRNVWCTINRKEHVSLTGVSAQAEYAHFLGKEEEVTFDAGFMWQETKRELKEQKIEAAVRIFAPLGVPAELMQVRVTNKSDMDMCVRVTSAIPIYGRSADNLRDHRHVTSLLHRIRTTGRGVICKPVLSFDERGHTENHMIYLRWAVREMEQNRNRSSQRWNRLSEKPEHFWHRMRLKIKKKAVRPVVPWMEKKQWGRWHFRRLPLQQEHMSIIFCLVA